MATTQSYRLKNPPHPGGFVRTEIIKPRGVSVTAAARVLGVTRAALSAFLNERAALSPKMALRIEKAFGVRMDTLMRMQNSYDISQARSMEGEIKVERFTGKPLLACISHHSTVEARDTTARTSLRLLAVLNVLFKYACARQAARAFFLRPARASP